MLKAFRAITTTWVGQILGVLLIIGLAGFGISNVITQLGSTTVANIAGQDISMRDFDRAYRQQIDQFAQSTGHSPTPQEAVDFGIPSVVLSRLTSEAALATFGTNLGLGVSDDKLAQLVRTDPSFGGGTLDRANFAAALQQAGYTQEEYFGLQTRASVRQQIISGLLGGTNVPNTVTDIFRRYSSDLRTIEYFVDTGDSLPPAADPTDADLTAYLSAHQADFRTKETRAVDLLVVSPETLAATMTAAEADISAEYERTKTSRVVPEQRTIRQIVLTTPELEKAFSDGVAAGTPIADVLAATGAKPDELGTFRRVDVTDPALAEAAFAVPLNGYAVIEGIGSKRAVTVSAIQPGSQITLADAHDDIAKALTLQTARAQFGDLLDQVEELRAARRPLSEIADRFKLKLAKLDLTSGGPELAGIADIPGEDAARVAKAVFDAEAGDLQTVALGGNRNVYFDLNTISPARDQTLAEVHDAVAAAWTKAETDKAIATQLDSIMAALKEGAAFADVAVGNNQTLLTSRPFSRAGDKTKVINQAVAAAVFAGGPDHFGTAVDGDGNSVVFHVTEVTPASGPLGPGGPKYLEDSLHEALYQGFVGGLMTEIGAPRLNTQAFNQVIGLDSTATQ